MQNDEYNGSSSNILKWKTRLAVYISKLVFIIGYGISVGFAFDFSLNLQVFLVNIFEKDCVDNETQKILKDLDEAIDKDLYDTIFTFFLIWWFIEPSVIIYI